MSKLQPYKELSDIILSLYRQREQHTQPIIEELIFSDQEKVLVKDHAGSDLYYIFKGEVHIEKGSSKEPPIILGVGDLMGEISFLLQSSRSATVRAAGPTHCLRVHAKPMRSWLSQNPQIAARFYQSLAAIIAKRLINSDTRQKNQYFFSQSFQQKSGSPSEKMAVYRFTVLANHIREQCESVDVDIQRKDKQLSEQFQEHRAELLQTGMIAQPQEFKSRLNAIASKLEEESKIYKQQRLEELRAVIQHTIRKIIEQLSKVVDGGQRSNIGQHAFGLLADLFNRTAFVTELRKASNCESLFFLTEIFSISQSEQQDPIGSLLNQEICALPSARSYRGSLLLLQQYLQQQLRALCSEVSLINDQTGAVFSMLFPLVLHNDGIIRMLSDDPKSFSSVEFNLQKYGKARYHFQQLSGIDDLLAEGALAGQQTLIVIAGLLDYVPDRIAFHLLTACHAALAPEGRLLCTATLPAYDETFFCDFLGWAKIRRSIDDWRSLIETCDLEVVEVCTDHPRTPAVLLSLQRR